MMPFYHAAQLSESLTSTAESDLGDRDRRVKANERLKRESEELDRPPPQLTPTAGRQLLQKMRPQVSASLDLARARGRAPSGPGQPSRFPGEPALYVGSGAHAADVKLLNRLQIRAVINCAPSVCKAPKDRYAASDIRYLELDARDDREFPLLAKHLDRASEFISSMHAEGRAVLVHCMAGVNRSATLAVAHLLLVQKRNLFEVFAECITARPSILQNPSFQLQLCALAYRHSLLHEPDEAAVSRALLSEPLAPPPPPESLVQQPPVEVTSAPDFGIAGDDQEAGAKAPANELTPTSTPTRNANAWTRAGESPERGVWTPQLVQLIDGEEALVASSPARSDWV